ncbi:MAG: DUF885 domain-containing protein [Deltaproteobacteria bacterium]|nr:DUF885 domain-containing protein [Deltaproteobacteria bacterium]
MGIDAFVERYHEHKTLNPNACVNLGVERNLDALPDPSLEGAATRLSGARSLLEEVESLRSEVTTFDQRLDCDLAALSLRAEIHADSYTFHGQTRLEQMPSAADDIGDGLFMLFINDPRPAEERLANILSRLRAVPAYLDALQRRLGTPLERWRAMDLEKVGELSSLFGTLENWSRESSWADHDALVSARVEAEVALAQYAEHLATLETHRALHLGDEVAREIVRLRGIEQPLEELHQIARVFLEENAEALAELASRLKKKYRLARDATIEVVEVEIRRRFAPAPRDRDPERILARYQSERDRVLEFIAERDLFPIPAEQEMKILRTPGFMTPSIPAGAMVSPAPFREGVRTSLIYLTLTDELVAHHCELDVPGMMIHEGIPGHHLQLATASAHPSVIRRHMSAMDQAEGWTTMLEDYMLDVGYMGELTDEARFVAKRDTNRIGARVAIDLFFMTGNRNYLDVGIDCDRDAKDPFVAAGSLLQRVTGFAPGRVEAELNWYSQERGYPLSYLTGNRLVWELKRDVAAALAGTLSGLALDRKFHEVFLHAGNMPVSFLRKVFAEQGLL